MRKVTAMRPSQATILGPQKPFWMAVLGGPDAHEDEAEEDVEDAKGEVDALHCKAAVAVALPAIQLDVVEHQVLQLLDGPRREHDP